MAEVEAFHPTMVQELELMREQNNLYGSLRVQEEQSKQQILGIKKIIHDINHNKVKPEDFIVPYGMGGYRRLNGTHKKELIDTYLKQLELEENKLKTINGQRLHRADEVGEQRLKVLRHLWYIMKNEHNFKDDELYEHVREYATVVTQKPYMRVENDINDTIKKAGEIIV